MMSPPENPRIIFSSGMKTNEYHPELVVSALQHGGIEDNDIGNVAIFIKDTDSVRLSGSLHYSHPDNNGQPAIELYSYNGESKVSTKAIAHEARHYADNLYLGRSAFVSSRGRRLRKIGASVASLGVSYAYSRFIGIDPLDPETPAQVITSSIIADMILCTSIALEYRTRKHEMRAFRAMRGIKSQNILVNTNNVPKTKIVGVGSVIKAMFVPNFKM